MEGENNLACVKIDIQDGVWQQPLEVKGKPKSWFDQLEDDLQFEEDKKAKTVADVSIYRVPESIKKANREAYDPLVVFLGPFHHKKDKEMAVMDQYKLQAVDQTLQRIHSMKTRKELAMKVRELDTEIRHSYEDSAVEWDEVTLSWIMTLDACFILQFLRMDLPNSSLFFHWHRADNIKRREMIVDILKMENQIPFCVLKTILELELENQLEDPVAFLARRLMNGSMGQYFGGFQFKINRDVNEEVIGKLIKGGVSHLLHLSRQVIGDFLSNSASGSDVDDPVKCCACDVQCGVSACIASPDGAGCFRRSWADRNLELHRISEADQHMSTIPSAVKLEEAGIKLKEDKEGKVRFERRCFRSSTLYLPRIIVDDDTEIFLRNLIAFEECQRQKYSRIKRVISRNVFMMDSLIDSREDVGLLRKAKVIQNYLGSDKEVAKLFNALCVGIMEEDDFRHVLKDVNEHYNSKVKIWMSEFRKEHCSSPWYFISFVAAVILLALTLLQTIYTMKSYYES